MDEKFIKGLLIFAIIGAIAFLLLAIFLIKNPLLFVIFLVLAASLGICAIIILKYRPFVIAKEYEKVLVFRFGKLVGCYGPGLVFILPNIDTYQIVDTRIKALDIYRQSVITKDNLKLEIDAVAYYRIVDPVKAVTNVENLEQNIELLVLSELRSIIGNINAEEVVSNIEQINYALNNAVKKFENEWGVDIISVQIKDVAFPPEVMDAMHKRKAAEEKKLAREKEIEALKMELDAIREAANKMDNKALLYYYIKALEKLGASQSTKFVLPLELSSFAAFFAQSIGKRKEDIESEIKHIWPILEEKLSKYTDEKGNVDLSKVNINELEKEIEDVKQNLSDNTINNTSVNNIESKENKQNSVSDDLLDDLLTDKK